MRAYAPAAGKHVPFSEMSRLTGIVPVKGALIAVLVSFADPATPGTARLVPPDDAEAVPNGYWPLDFGGALGEPVTRGVQAKLPWLSGTGDSAATALLAAGLPGIEAIDAREAFTRK